MPQVLVKQSKVTRVLLDYLSPELASSLMTRLRNALPEKERAPLGKYMDMVHAELREAEKARNEEEAIRRRDELKI